MSNDRVDVANAEIVPRGDYNQILKKIVEEGNCPFCREHLLRHHSEPIISESSYWIVTRNFRPYNGAVHHFLLISRAHVERIEDLSETARSAFFHEYDRLVQKYELVGATILWRSGNTKITGASVSHLHAHVVVGTERQEHSVSITGLVGFQKP